MTKHDPDNFWNRALDGADSPQDGIHRLDLERLLDLNAHDVRPKIAAITVVVDTKDNEVLIEKGRENVLIKASEINGLIEMLLKAKDLMGECRGE